jgi:hypothetical protein
MTLTTEEEGHKGKVSYRMEISRVTALGVEPPRRMRSSAGNRAGTLRPGPQSWKE